MSTPREWDLYVEEKGREPTRLPEDHPYYLQWVYGQLSKDERDELLQELLTKEVDENQESLFP